MRAPIDGRGSSMVVGRVAEVWRYPVKSTGGESVAHARCDQRGLEGDRAWAVAGEDGEIGSGKTTRRFRRMPGLLTLTSCTDGNGSVWIELPDGRRGRTDDPETARWVSEIVGARVRFQKKSGAELPYFDDGPVHLVTTGEIADLQGSSLGGVVVDRRRFRPNLVVEADGDLLAGRRYLVGERVVLAVTAPTVRCVMTTMAQPGLERAPSILKDLTRRRDACFGVYASVERGGAMAVGDLVTLLA